MADWAEKFAEITAKTHTEQAVWWLNGFWDDQKDTAEEVWDMVQLFQELQTGRKKMYGKRVEELKEGSDLDEMKAHQFLEKCGETLTVRALREKLSKIDIDKNNKLAVIEYLLFKYEKTPKDVCDAPQGDADPAELQKAQDDLNAAQSALIDVIEALAKQKAAEEAVKKAEVELKAAMEDLQRQEADYNGKIAAEEKMANDDSLGVVKRNRAKNVLQQLKAEDPLPLRKAKILQAAAIKKAGKEKKKAEAATAQVAEDKKAAEAAVEAAVAQIAKVKAMGTGVAQGQIWWMEREVIEMKKFMPRR